MQRFDAADLVQAIVNPHSNATQLVFESPGKERLALNLSQPARENIAKALLGKPVVTESTALNMHLVRTDGFQTLLLDRSIPVIEFRIHRDYGIPITFPIEQLETLKDAIQHLIDMHARNQQEKS